MNDRQQSLQYTQVTSGSSKFSSQDPMSLDSPLVAHDSSLTPSLEAVFNPVSNLDISLVEEAPSRTSALVLQRISAFFQSSTVITEAEFVLSCKKVVALLQLSEPKDVDRVMVCFFPSQFRTDNLSLGSSS